MIESLFVVLLGLAIGSFLNVIIYRLPRDLSCVKPASACTACQKPIRWYENVPLLSYLFLRGKCNACGARISFQYPLVELLTAVLFFLALRNLSIDLFSILSQIRIWVFISLCVAITFIDLEHRIIPDELSLGGWAFGVLTCAWDFRYGPWALIIASVVGFGFFYGFAVLYEKITGRVGLGGGDIKFMGTIGIFLGLGGIWTSLLLSSLIGTVAGLIYARFFQKKRQGLLKASIPYGPFLVIGALIELFFEVSRRFLNG